MFVKVNSPHKDQNTGSCKDLVNYLDKEESTTFFSSDREDIPTNEVVKEIDKNGKGGLKKNEDKFYMLSINPSHRELEHLIGRKVASSADLTPYERLVLEKELQAYTHDVMNIYAKNFGRENIQDNKDLVYFARIETSRTHRHYDKEVENGSKRCGDLKDGLNYHVHVIVSRKAKDNKTLLSPNAKSRGNKWKNTNGSETTRGFNHEAFKTNSIKYFNEKYNYKSYKNETYYRKNNYNQTKNIAKNTANSVMRNFTGDLSKELSITKGQFAREQQILSKATRIATTTVRAIANPVGTAKAEILNAIKGLANTMNKSM